MTSKSRKTESIRRLSRKNGRKTREYLQDDLGKQTIDVQNDSQGNDPEPLLSIALFCVGTLAMAGTIANAVINYRKYVTDDVTRKEDQIADFRVAFDLFRASGTRLLDLVSIVAENGLEAFEMVERLPRIEEGPSNLMKRTLRAGETSLDLEPNQIQTWNTLLNTVSHTIGDMNIAVQTHEQRFEAILKAARGLEVVSSVGLEPLITNVVDHAIRFRKAFDSFQNLRCRKYRRSGTNALRAIGASNLRNG